MQERASDSRTRGSFHSGRRRGHVRQVAPHRRERRFQRWLPLAYWREVMPIGVTVIGAMVGCLGMLYGVVRPVAESIVAPVAEGMAENRVRLEELNFRFDRMEARNERRFNEILEELRRIRAQ